MRSTLAQLPVRQTPHASIKPNQKPTIDLVYRNYKAIFIIACDGETIVIPFDLVT